MSARILAKRGGQCRTKVVVPHFPWASVKHKTEEAYRIYYQELFELIALRQLFGTNKSPEKTCQRGGSASAQAWTFDKLNVRITDYTVRQKESISELLE